jgi:hypothetical protein
VLRLPEIESSLTVSFSGWARRSMNPSATSCRRWICCLPSDASSPDFRLCAGHVLVPLGESGDRWVGGFSGECSPWPARIRPRGRKVRPCRWQRGIHGCLPFRCQTPLQILGVVSAALTCPELLPAGDASRARGVVRSGMCRIRSVRGESALGFEYWARAELLGTHSPGMRRPGFLLFSAAAVPRGSEFPAVWKKSQPKSGWTLDVIGRSV